MKHSKVSCFRDLHNKHRFEETTLSFSPLWHYTSGNGLMGIIRNDTREHGKLHFWFTRSDCLNDPSEGTHIKDLYKSTCESLLHEGNISVSFFEQIKDLEASNHQFVNFPIPPRDGYDHESVLDCVACDAFICCFSLKEDSLDMWRFYSKGDGGYGLKCAPFLFDRYKDYESSDYEKDAVFSMIRAYKVIYQNEEKVAILREIILDTFSAYQNETTSEGDNLENALGFIRYALKVFQFQFKHECYATEQEYRFVFYRPYSKPQMLKNELPPVKFRSQNGVIVPYIDIIVENGASYLSEVLISPFIESDFALATTHEYVGCCGFSCTTRKSTLPVRN